MTILRRIGVLAFLTRRIPIVTASEIGFFRVVFGILLWHAFRSLALSSDPFPRELHLTRSWLADWEWVHWLASHPETVARLEALTLATMSLFIIGLWARLMFWLLAAELMVWTLVRLQHTGTHPWAVAFIAVICLLPIRWGDGFSVDEMIRRWRGRALRFQRRGRSYGFALWLPGLIFGTAMAAAGVAKLRRSGLDWILSGAVKYHFVTDAENAPVDWGLWIASQPELAVAMSLLAVATEISLGLGPLFRGYLARLPLGLAGLGLLLGFYLFQGELWLAWWMLWALFYLPWPFVFRLLKRMIPAHVVLIDDDCPRCRASARVLSGLDWFDRIRFESLQSVRARTRYGISGTNEKLLQTMHTVCCRDHRVVRGYRAYLHVARSLPVCWPLVPVGSLLLLGNLGERLYAWLAVRRRHMRGEVCALQSGVRPPSLRLSGIHASIVILVCALQLTASAARIEVEPLMSDYPMYSDTYESTADFDRRVRHGVFSLLAVIDGQEIDATALFQRLKVDGIFRSALERLVWGEYVSEDMKAGFLRGVSLVESDIGGKLTRISLKADQQTFDWTRGRFDWKYRDTVIGTLDLQPLTFQRNPAVSY